MSPLERSAATRSYWRSLEELADTDRFRELQAKEFPAGDEEHWTESSRRRFLQLIGASVALASASSCYWQKETIAPFNERPEDRIPGKPRYFASAMEVGGVGRALLVTSYDGRPTKVDGNPEHPASRGASEVWAQASTLEMYDPDRSRGPMRAGADGALVDSSWKEFEAWVAESLPEAVGPGGAGLAVIAEASSSPARAAAQEALQRRFPQLRWVEYEPVSRQNELLGCVLAFGSSVRPRVDFSQAKVVLSLDDDPLQVHPGMLANVRGYAANRKPEKGPMSRLYAVEARYTTTGAAADHRLPLRAEQVGPFLADLEDLLVREYGLKLPDREPRTVSGGRLKATPVPAFLAALASDLASNRGAGLICVGSGQPPEVHARAQRLNVLLGNLGKTVDFLPARPGPDFGAFRKLSAELAAGKVPVVVVLGGNPVYDAPGDLDFAAAYAKASTRIHFGLFRDETAHASTWHLPRAHALECWGDCRTWDGTYTLQQPLIEPLWGGRSPLEFLSLLAGNPEADGMELVQAASGQSGAAWRKLVHDGFLLGSAAAPVEVQPRQLEAPKFEARQLQEGDLAAGELEIAFYAHPHLYDGRYANNGWLLELPEPLTTLTWDNAALLSMRTAEALGIENGTLVDLELDGRTVRLPAYVEPGHADGSISVALGFGRTAAGHVGGLLGDDAPPVGTDVNPLRRSTAPDFDHGLRVVATGIAYQLATAQDHHLIDTLGMEGRAERVPELVREADLAEWKEDPQFAAHEDHHEPLVSLWEERTYEGVHKWGMSVDLATCVGCNACTIACQSENNISVVGKEQVLKGREMHWIRLDRYFTGSIESPRVLTQPMTCQQCEMAPCEEVCPVAATMHTDEGLNDMVYNRCVGTRYCANNCPFKVRRFNFHLYNENLRDPENEVLKMGKNPEVTIRSRGVMEKCSYCVQRIASARHDARLEGRPIRDGEVTPACAQVCPAEAIVFGDLNDLGSRVSAEHANPRAYEMLAELNLKTRNRFLARVRNPHPALAERVGAASEEVEHHG